MKITHLRCKCCENWADACDGDIRLVNATAFAGHFYPTLNCVSMAVFCSERCYQAEQYFRQAEYQSDCDLALCR